MKQVILFQSNGSEKLPIFRYNMTEEELEIIINHLIDSKNVGIYGYRTSMRNAEL